jgi:hypothetical protein
VQFHKLLHNVLPVALLLLLPLLLLSLATHLAGGQLLMDRAATSPWYARAAMP